MTNKKFLFIVMLLFAVTFPGFSANAADFYGANVTDREVPTVAWRAGITGYRPIVGHVSTNSPAEKHGFKRGNIIISVNGKEVRNTGELSLFTADTLSVRVFDGMELKTLSIDRQAIEKEKTERIDAARKTAPPPPPIVPDEPADNSPTMEFNDEILYKRTISPAPDETK